MPVEESRTITIRHGAFPLFQKYLRVYYESNALFLTPTLICRGMTELASRVIASPPFGPIEICPLLGSMEIIPSPLNPVFIAALIDHSERFDARVPRLIARSFQWRRFLGLPSGQLHGSRMVPGVYERR